MKLVNILHDIMKENIFIFPKILDSLSLSINNQLTSLVTSTYEQRGDWSLEEHSALSVCVCVCVGLYAVP